MRNRLALLIAFAAVLAVSCEKSDADRLEKLGIQTPTSTAVPGINLTKSEAEMKLSAAGPIMEPRDVEFTVNRDFLFEIIDSSSGAAVFIGQHKM